MRALANKYRPKTFSELIGQPITAQILQNQINTNSISHTYLFAGNTGCGKTSIAKILANEINKGVGEPIEIDGASNNGVDNVRTIIENAKQRSLTSEYKVFIIDECHAITTQGWQAFLKGIEEPAPYTIYIFCTTEPNKIPKTILNRLQRYNIAQISAEDIKNRLIYICQQEGFKNYDTACDFISKTAQGCMRDAITMLDQCADYSLDLSIENVKLVLGDLSYETMLKLTNSIFDQNQAAVLNIIKDITKHGQDLKQFINAYLDFVLDLTKYVLFKDISVTNIPVYLETVNQKEINVQYTVGLQDALKVFNNLADKLLELKVAIKFDLSYKTTIEVTLLHLCRGV